MAYIGYVADEEATPELGRLYDRYRGPTGVVDNILRIHSLNPPSMKAHFDLYHLLMRGPSRLSLVQREMIGVVVSAINCCHY